MHRAHQIPRISELFYKGKKIGLIWADDSSTDVQILIRTKGYFGF
jgi:hypothetical protein